MPPEKLSLNSLTVRDLRAPTNFQFNSESWVFSEHLLCANPMGHRALLAISWASGGGRDVNKYIMKWHPEYGGRDVLWVQRWCGGGAMSQEGKGDVWAGFEGRRVGFKGRIREHGGAKWLSRDNKQLGTLNRSHLEVDPGNMWRKPRPTLHAFWFAEHWANSVPDTSSLLSSTSTFSFKFWSLFKKETYYRLLLFICAWVWLILCVLLRYSSRYWKSNMSESPSRNLVGFSSFFAFTPISFKAFAHKASYWWLIYSKTYT